MINIVSHTGDAGDAPRRPANPTNKDEPVEIWAATGPIEPGQSVWLWWQEQNEGGELITPDVGEDLRFARSTGTRAAAATEPSGDPLHYVQCNWRHNGGDRSYWCGTIGPFHPDAVQVIYGVFARQGKTVVTVPTPDFFKFGFGEQPKPATGGPGQTPVWSSGAKEGFGTAVSETSRVWFSHSEGTLNEIYYPRLDKPNTRDFQLLVLDDQGKFLDPKLAPSTVQYLDTLLPGSDGIPRALAYRITNEDQPSSGANRYQIVMDVLADPSEDSVLIGVEYKPLVAQAKGFRVFALINPHMNNSGAFDCGKFVWHGGYRMFLSWDNGIYCAMAISRPVRDHGCGYVGVNDGWKDLLEHKDLTYDFNLVEKGNIAATMEIGLDDSDRKALITLSFGQTEQEALDRALRTVTKSLPAVTSQFLAEWQSYVRGLETQGQLASITAGQPAAAVKLAYVSAMVIKAMEDKTQRGAIIASPAIPWGDCTTDSNQGGYHLVWGRDLYNMATAAMAVGDYDMAVRILKYFDDPHQESNGSMPQNSWIDGHRYWDNEQLDETGYPILIAYRLKREGRLTQPSPSDIYRSLVVPAADFLAGYGDTWTQDRWEEVVGRSPFTLAVVVAALVAAGKWSEEAGQQPAAQRYYARAAHFVVTDFNDCWVTRNGQEYLARIYNPWNDWFKVFMDVIDAGFLELVRLGIKSPNHPRIQQSLTVVDQRIRQDINGLPYFLRYGRVDGQGGAGTDTYGEKDNGYCWTGDGSGRGRLWPLLSGERAHYELAKSDASAARVYLNALVAAANAGYMQPEQIWNATDIPIDEHKNRLVKGKGTKGATPLGWAHGEFLKLLRSLKDGKVFDLVPEVEAWAKNTHVDQNGNIVSQGPTVSDA